MNTARPVLSRMPPVAWLGAMLVTSLIVVTLARWQGWHERAPVAQVSWDMSLYFEDMPNGDVRVTDARNGQEVAQFSGEQGFLRGTLRAMARQRRVTQTERNAPLLLRGLSDGRLQLVDPMQGLAIDLDSFGPSNKAVFAGLRRSTLEH